MKKWQFWPKNVITQIFQRPYNLISILAEVHFLFRAVCNICGLDISNPNYLEKHKKVVHDGLYDFSCHHCGKLFSVLPLLKTHLATAHKDGDAYFSCNIGKKNALEK